MSLKIIFYILCGCVVISCFNCSRKRDENSKNASDSVRMDNSRHRSKLMLDGKLWLIENLTIKERESYCQQDDEQLCTQYGRLYTWQAAKEACNMLGDEWRLPTDEEWQTMAKFYGGIYKDSLHNGKLAYINLMEGGYSGFNAWLGGNREADGNYQRLGEHGFYWTASAYDSANAWFYNFAKGSTLLNHHTGDKRRAVSVRCIKDAAKQEE